MIKSTRVKKKILAFVLILCAVFELSMPVWAMNKSKTANFANEDILVKALLYAKWLPVPDIANRNYSELRNLIIDQLNQKCNESIIYIDGLNDSDLVWRGVLSYKFLLDAGLFTAIELKSRSFAQNLKSIIKENKLHTDYSMNQIEQFTVQENLNLAYSWWFVQNPSTKNILDKLNNISYSNPIFALKDNRNYSMDCLRIIKSDETYTYLGVYHHAVGSNYFKLYLAGSNDLKSWIYINDLGDRSHQGDLKKWGNGYLLANEQDQEMGSNNIRIRYYSSYEDLITNKASHDKSIPRNFSEYAEGTPDIRFIHGSTPAQSHIVIGFHYYHKGIRDQQAIGILSNFDMWKAWKDEISNSNITAMGYQGNIGARYSFAYSGDFVLNEAQIKRNDWSSWRLLFGDGAFYCTLNPISPLGSISFANPGISPIGADQFVITGFMPTEGNKKEETGELRYVVQF